MPTRSKMQIDADTEWATRSARMVGNVRSAMVIFMLKKRVSFIAAAACIALAPLQEAHADWASAITRQAAKQGSKRAADQATKDTRLIEQKLKKAAREIVAVFKKNGISGTVIRVENCYKNNLYDQYCLYMDTAGRHMDYIGTQIFGTNYTDYYSDRMIRMRFDRFAKHMQMNTDEINNYIRLIYEPISQIIDREM